MDKISSFGNNFGKNFSNLGSQLTPFANRTQQYWREQLGQGGDRTDLPADYVELEKRVDALKLVHQKLLAVTACYGTEAYDYPANYRESFNDMSRTVSEKVTLLSSAKSPQEAQAAITAPPSAKPQPKTLNHAIARASLAGSQALNASQPGASEEPLASALEKYALAEEKVGEARLEQDKQIQQRFLAGWKTTLSTNLAHAQRARQAVENARLSLDATKAKAPKGQAIPEEIRSEIEHKEDEFVGQVEEASAILKTTLDTPEPLRNLAELLSAQISFHQRSMEILSELAPVIDELQQANEADYRQNRARE